MGKCAFVIFTCCLVSWMVQAQDKHLIDSLQAVLQASKEDTNRAHTLYQLSKAYRKNNPDRALDYALQSMVLSEKLGFTTGIGSACNILGAIRMNMGDYPAALDYFNRFLKISEETGDKPGLAIAYHNIGNIHYAQGNYTGALKYHFNALQIKKELGNKQGIASSLNSIGSDYLSQGNYPEALKYHFQSLRIQEELGNKSGLAASYGNIGIIYSRQGNLAEALKNHQASLKLNMETGDKKGMADCYTNIGIIYKRQQKLKEAFANYKESLKISEELGDKSGIGRAHNNIGSLYMSQGNLEGALTNFQSSLKIFKEIGFPSGIVNSYNSLGKIYTRQKKYGEAASCLEQALTLSRKIGSLDDLLTTYGNMATLDSARGQYKNSLEYYKMSVLYRDSIYNEENTKKSVRTQMQYEFDKKEAVAKAEQEKINELAKREMQKQKWVRNGFIGGFAVVLLFAAIFFRQRRKIWKEKKKSEELLLNILPTEVADELKLTGSAKSKSFGMVSVMFTDFKDFTKISEKISAELLVDELHYCFSAFDTIIGRYKIEKIKTIGDSYLCASGLPAMSYTHAQDIVSAAVEIRDFILNRKKEKEAKGEIPFELRIGIHTGPVVAGIVGVKKFAYDIWGDTVNVAARMEQGGEVGRINISGSTYELVKEKFRCIHRGKIDAKNKGEIDMYFAEPDNDR